LSEQYGDKTGGVISGNVVGNSMRTFGELDGNIFGT
jgi:hypothetical protein